MSHVFVVFGSNMFALLTRGKRAQDQNDRNAYEHCITGDILQFHLKFTIRSIHLMILAKYFKYFRLNFFFFVLLSLFSCISDEADNTYSAGDFSNNRMQLCTQCAIEEANIVDNTRVEH